MNRAHALLIAVAAAIGLGGGIYLSLSSNPDAGKVGRPAIDSLYETTFPDLSAQTQKISQWKSKTLVINFWATWCPPCREEIPGLIRIQGRYSAKNVQIVGIALDSPEPVAGFAKLMGINYPVLLGGLDAINLARLLGNATGGLPFTIVLSPNGDTSLTHLGMLSESQLESVIAKVGPASHP